MATSERAKIADDELPARREDRPGDVEAAVGDRDRAEEHLRGGVLAAEGGGRRRHVGQDRHEGEDPEQHRHVAEDVDVDAGELADEPVRREAQHADEHADDGREDAAEDGDEEGVEDADERGAAVGAVVGVGDQRLVDVVAGAAAEEAEVEVLAERGEVLDGVVDQPGRRQHEGEQREDLDGERSVPRVVDQHAEPEALGRHLHDGHLASPPRLRVRPGPRRWRSRHPVGVPGAGRAPGRPAGISGTAARRSGRRRSTGR